MQQVYKRTSTIDPLLVNSKEAAEMLGISERTLWSPRKRGAIAHVRQGRRVQYHIEDVKAYAASLRKH